MFAVIHPTRPRAVASIRPLPLPRPSRSWNTFSVWALLIRVQGKDFPHEIVTFLLCRRIVAPSTRSWRSIPKSPTFYCSTHSVYEARWCRPHASQSLMYGPLCFGIASPRGEAKCPCEESKGYRWALSRSTHSSQLIPLSLLIMSLSGAAIFAYSSTKLR